MNAQTIPAKWTNVGVGVYSSDFNGTGTTFIVSPDFHEPENEEDSLV